MPKRAGTLLLIGLFCAWPFLCAACADHRAGPKGQTAGVSVETADHNSKLQGAHVSVEPEEYLGACPVHIRTTGGITGAPGLAVSYRFIGNGSTWSPTRRGVIPASGMLRVFEVANVDAAHAGYFFRQLWVIVNGGTLDKFSNRALYTVSCIVQRRPAAKRVALATDTPMYQGPCPKVVHFMGSISAQPGARVRYLMFGNGAAWGRMHSAVIGSSGTLAVSEALALDAAHTGYFFRQLWVIGHDGEADAFSGRALYSLSCVAGTPGPNASYTLFDISSPTEFASANSPEICGDHLEPQRAATLCGAPLANGQLVLVWNWKPDGCPSGPCRSRLDGYRVYQTLGKLHRFVTTQSDSALTIAALTQKTSEVAGNCYTVRAFFGNDESSDSNEVCVKAGYGEALTHITLRPIAAIPLDAGSLAAKFDLIKLPAGVAVWNATLQFAGASKKAGRPRNLCVGAVELASAAVSAHSGGAVPADPYLGVAERASWIDVTSAVRAWTRGAHTNFGFVLRPADQRLATHQRSCSAVERDLALTVDYLNL